MDARDLQRDGWNGLEDVEQTIVDDGAARSAPLATAPPCRPTEGTLIMDAAAWMRAAVAARAPEPDVPPSASAARPSAPDAGPPEGWGVCAWTVPTPPPASVRRARARRSVTVAGFAAELRRIPSGVRMTGGAAFVLGLVVTLFVASMDGGGRAAPVAAAEPAPAPAPAAATTGGPRRFEASPLAPRRVEITRPAAPLVEVASRAPALPPVIELDDVEIPVTQAVAHAAAPASRPVASVAAQPAPRPASVDRRRQKHIEALLERLGEEQLRR